MSLFTTREYVTALCQSVRTVITVKTNKSFSINQNTNFKIYSLTITLETFNIFYVVALIIIVEKLYWNKNQSMYHVIAGLWRSYEFFSTRRNSLTLTALSSRLIQPSFVPFRVTRISVSLTCSHQSACCITNGGLYQI